MKKRDILIVFALNLCLSTSLHSGSGPFSAGKFKGRIAYSTDGNYNDEDDWAANAMAIAILGEYRVMNKVVHFDFNSILPKTDPSWEEQNRISVYGAAERFGLSRSVIYDCQRDLNGAIDNIKNQINASSADNPLYFIIAGPMQVAARGIVASDASKRQYVYCISHNNWNDGYKSAHSYNKRDIIPLGINWIQIQDQNRWLSTSPYGRPATPSEWELWHWMRDSSDPDLQWVYSRIQATTRADTSDAGMTFFLLSGDEVSSLSKVEKLLDKNQIPTPLDPRRTIRMEAENFRILENYSVEYGDRGASQRLNVKLSSITPGHIRTTFREPYTAPNGHYNVDVRYLDESGGQATFRLRVNGIQQGSGWSATSDDNSWKTQTLSHVTIAEGDEIEVEVQGHSGEYGELDYVQLNFRE